MFVSILGDSISTYQGYQPPGYAVYYQDYYRYINELNSVYDTWWAKVNQYLRAYICATLMRGYVRGAERSPFPENYAESPSKPTTTPFEGQF